MYLARWDWGRDFHFLDWLRAVALDRSEGTAVFSGGASLAELESRGQTLEADECGDVLLAVLTNGLHGRWDVVNDRGRPGASPLGLHVIHDGDIGDVGICGHEGTLWACDGFGLRLGVQALATEGVATCY